MRVLKTRKPTAGRDGLWAEIRRQQDFTVPSLVKATDAKYHSAAQYVEALILGGYVVREEPGEGCRTVRYRLARDCGVMAPRLRRDGTPSQGSRKHEHMWRTAKILRGSFTVRDLALWSSTEAVLVNQDQARYYLRWLVKAGYVVAAHCEDKAKAPRYLFVGSKNTGPKPPVIVGRTQVLDANLMRIVYPATGERAA